MHRFLLPFLALGILLAPPAFGFFDVLDDLQQELTEEESSNPLDLDDLINELEQTTEQSDITFTDVPASAWYYDAVYIVARHGVVSGYKDANGNPTGQFGPGNPVTIAEILKMAYEAAGQNITLCKQTVRLPQAASHWAGPYVACAEEDGMRVLGTQPDLNRGAMRAEVIAIIHDAFREQVPSGRSPFADTAGHPYEADIAYASIMGVVSGDNDPNGLPTGTFRPNDGINRAEAAQVISKMLSL